MMSLLIAGIPNHDFSYLFKTENAALNNRSTGIPSN